MDIRKIAYDINKFRILKFLIYKRGKLWKIVYFVK